MLGWIGKAFDLGWQIGSAIKGNQWQNSVSLTQQRLELVASSLANGMSGAWWALERLRESAENTAGAAANAGAQWGGAFTEVKLMLSHIYGVMIPRTVANAVGYVYADGIGPLNRLTKLQGSEIDDLYRDDISEQRWRANKAEPLFGDLIRLAGWLGGLDRFPDLPGSNAKQWLAGLAYAWANPSAYMDLLFARINQGGNVMPSVAVSWLANEAHRGGLDDLLLVLITRSPDHFRYIEDAMLAVLSSPYP